MSDKDRYTAEAHLTTRRARGANSMKEEFDLTVEVTLTYLRTIQADDQEEAQEIAENEAIEMAEEIQEEYELDDFDQEVTIRKYRTPQLPSIKLTKKK
jgi:hypothetical protein